MQMFTDRKILEIKLDIEKNFNVKSIKNLQNRFFIWESFQWKSLSSLLFKESNIYVRLLWQKERRKVKFLYCHEFFGCVNVFLDIDNEF